ncbi:MAG: histidine phosphatase family protein [Anaerolineae bacterium]|nr:MAG: histidine phosphatase family protein [Anaerolineae bacterium]
MTQFWLIRHGQSEMNAGSHAESPASSPLTALGRQQIQAMVEHIPQRPDLIVSSEYVRAVESADMLRQRFPDVPYEVWPIHEFTFLAEDKYTRAGMKGLGREYFKYWWRSRPDQPDGPGAETFNDFIARVDTMLDRMRDSPHNFVIVCGHGWFNRALVWQMMNRVRLNGYRRLGWSKKVRLDHSPPGSIMAKYSSARFLTLRNHMLHFLTFCGGVAVPNGSIMKFFSTVDNRLIFEGIFADHLPDEIRGSGIFDK